MAINEVKEKYPPIYYVNILWTVYDNSVKHLNMVMPFDKLTTLAPIHLRFPSSSLPQFVVSMGSQYVMNSITLLYACREAADRAGN